MRASFVRPLVFLCAGLLSLVLTGCDGCGGTGVGTDEDAGTVPVGACEDHDDCPSGRCEGGTCMPVTPHHDAGPGHDAGGGDAGEAIGVLAVHPGHDVEFGAQLLGYPVTVDVTLSNVGNATLTLFAVLLDDDTGEFSAEPSGTMSVRLAPGENMLVHLTHTPSDGLPDAAEVKILHDGEGNLTTLSLYAEFKGDAALSLSEDLDVITPSADAIAFGEHEPGTSTTRTLWVRNIGSADSILTVSSATITPANAGFALVDLPPLPFALGAWNTALCPSGDVAACPPGASACEETLCVDDEGEPLNALPIDIEFTASALPSQATLTLRHDEGGGATQTDIELFGLPTQPELLVTPSEVAFGPTLVDDPQPAEVVITVENIGAGPLLITRVVEPTSTTAFTFNYSRPVPKLVGDPHLRIDAGAPPLEITVTFTPTAAEGYAASLSLHTNDGSALQLPIPLSGSGVACQANAHVDGSGSCVCDTGFIACGGECKQPGPTACGSSCVDCTAVSGFGPGTNASCSIAGTCEYMCADNYWDIDGDLGNPGSSGWNGCEYACVQQSTFEICNGVDDNCDGQIDEGLPLDPSDTPTRNDMRQTAKVVPPIHEVPATKAPGSTSTLTGHTLYPAGDEDWFKVKAVEADSGFDCAQEVPCIEGGQENYQTRFEIVSPSGLTYDIQVWAPTGANYEDPNGTGTLFTDDDNDGVITLNWSRSSSFGDCALCWLVGACFPGGYGCGFDDSQVFFVNVKPRAGRPNDFSCEPYELKVTSISLPPGSGN